MMKHFFSHRFPKWDSPLDVFPVFRDKNPHLFFSGETENPEISGQFSFLTFSSLSSHEKNENRNKNRNWRNIQEKFLEKSAEYKKSDTLKNWKFPFCGGITGVFSYDFIRELHRFSENSEMSKTLPLLEICEQFFAFDHTKKEYYVAGWFSGQNEADLYFSEIILLLENRDILAEKTPPEISLSSQKFLPEISRDEYEKKFQICQDEIEKGNSFQINFSQKFLAKTKSSAWDIFLNATQKNSAQMMYFYENTDTDFSLISCSPERLFSCDRNQNIFTQPIAGTRPRGKNRAEEKKLEDELTTSLKELSEHSMIVDLLRNDFGKVSEFGSVKVETFMRVEKYKTVMHLVSDIVGKIAPEKNIFDVFESLFPGGTITGAPKTETMKILEREETSSRNFYCGSAGYFSFCGSADWNILIRTLEKEGKNISGRAGGGLVFGANPENEYQETLHKFSGVEKMFQ